MTSLYFQAMQAAVVIVGESPHPVNKVAASVMDEAGGVISSTNLWPPVIQKKLGQDARIGTASGTVHAETACLLKTPCTRGGRIFITDPPCPNCTKNIVEAGVGEIYIDHKGFEKDYARRRGGDFFTMTLRICEEAGISVYEIRRKEEMIIPIMTLPPELYRLSLAPELYAPLKAGFEMNSLIAKAQEEFGAEPFALGIARDEDGQNVMLGVGRREIISEPEKQAGEKKYTFVSEPLNRLLMTARALGLTLEADTIASCRVPSGREMVNLLGAGYSALTILDTDNARDESCYEALALLREHNILNVIARPPEADAAVQK